MSFKSIQLVIDSCSYSNLLYFQYTVLIQHVFIDFEICDFNLEFTKVAIILL